MSNGMDQDWFAPEVPPAPETGPRKAPGASPEHAPGGALAPATKTADEKPLEEKPEDWFSKPSTSTKNGEEEASEDWFEKAPEMKSKTAPKKNLPQEVETPPPMISPPKIPPPKVPPTMIAPPKDTQIPTKEEDSDNWFAKVPEKPTGTDSTVTMVKSQPRKEAYMYGYISKVIENIPNNTASNSNFSEVFKKVISKVLDDKRMEDSSLPGPPAYKKEGGGGRAAAAMVIIK